MSKSDTISIDSIYNALPNNILIPGQPVIYMKDTLSWIIRQKPDENIIRALNNISPEWLSKKLQLSFSTINTDIYLSLPVYRYGLFKVKKEEFLRNKRELSEVRPFMKFKYLQAKPRFNSFNGFYRKWVSNYLDRGIIIHKNYNGYPITIHKKGDKVQILTEDGKDRTNELPNITKELLKIKHNFILETDVTSYNLQGKIVKSALLKESCNQYLKKDINWIIEGKILPEQESTLVFHVLDILYLDGKSLINNPYEERLNMLSNVVNDSAYLVKIEYKINRTPVELRSTIEELRKKGAIGIVARIADSYYPVRAGENRSTELAMLRDITDTTFEFKECLYHKDKVLCPLTKEHIKFPVTCSLASNFKCKFIKNIFYGEKEYDNKKD